MTTIDVSGAERYNPEKLLQLEKHVDNQVAQGTYQKDANLALLRLYQFMPERINTTRLTNLLVKALMQLPSPEFKTCLYLISDHIQAQEPLASLIVMASHLEACRFKDFWAAVDHHRDLLNAVPGFYDAVRAYALDVLGATYQRVSKSTLTEVLRLEGMGLDTLVISKCKNGGWSVAPDSGGSIIILPKTNENHPKTVVVKENKGDGLAKLIKVVMA